MTIEVSPAARVVAQRLAALFTRDQQLAVALKDAHDRLLDANGRLTSGLSADALHRRRRAQPAGRGRRAGGAGAGRR